ncbi:hypothetical protein [Streptomyces sp. CBMA29]|uniref:hypothetical protein n=1 Tax=Streptomyces sp. CBMA29 TaxID=1896314 RepID=UPI001661B5AC|nr:hypothetical protein [Streptomyces sp. CBMA29]MBD0738065.1 hypothetical protein [Streptomyces sp. CBMA29]
MDPEIAALAGTAGTTVVTLMASDAWQRTREGLVAMWRRVHPDRADAVDAELEATRADLIAARAAHDDQSEDELRAEWQGRLRRLLAADPAVADQLRLLLEDVSPQVPADVPGVRMRATATGHGRVYQAARDQHITEA